MNYIPPHTVNDWIIDSQEWQFAGHLGIFGNARNRIIDLLDEKFGHQNWKIAYKLGNAFVDRDFALQLYEDAYFVYLLNNPDITNWIVHNYSDVYDNALSNTNSGFDYYIQEHKCTHLQDIAVRRVILRLGLQFRGNKLLEIRGEESEGFALNPGNVVFHLPNIIEPSGHNPTWSKNNTIEAFWQCNKVLLVRKSIELPNFEPDVYTQIRRELAKQINKKRALLVSDKTIWNFLRKNQVPEVILKEFPAGFLIWVKEVSTKLEEDYKKCLEKHQQTFETLPKQKDASAFAKQISSLTGYDKHILFAMFKNNQNQIPNLVWRVIKPEFIRFWSPYQ